MGYSATISHMINTLKYNRSLLKRKGYFKLKEEYLELKRGEGLEFKKASPWELQQLRKKLIERRKRQTIMKLLVLAVSLLIAWIFIHLLGELILGIFDFHEELKHGI